MAKESHFYVNVSDSSFETVKVSHALTEKQVKEMKDRIQERKRKKIKKLKEDLKKTETPHS